jgi:hypothetical protein
LTNSFSKSRPNAKHLLADAVRVRTCSEICVDADNHSDDLGYLSDLWKEVVSNKYKYSIVELKFMLEHLENYAKEMGRRDAQKLKQLLADGLSRNTLKNGR